MHITKNNKIIWTRPH